jgi:hypothetical protein
MPPARELAVTRVPPRTLLEQLIRESDYSFEEWAERFRLLAKTLGEDATLSSRNLQRWASGQITDARPAARRVAFRLWGHPFHILVSRPVVAVAGAWQRMDREFADGAGADAEVVRTRLPATVAGEPLIGGDPEAFVARVASDRPVPRTATQVDVEIVVGVTRSLAQAENRHGGAVVVEAGLGQLRWAAVALGAFVPSNVRQPLLEGVGNLAAVVGFAAFDVAEHEVASRCFRLALWCAEQGECWTLRACTLADLARLHAAAGDVDSALSAIELAQVRSDRIAGTAQAMLGAMRARYLARLGRHAEAVRAAHRADELFHSRDAGDDPPYLRYYDVAEHNGSVARALMPVAIETHAADLASSRLRTAVELQAPDYPRSRTFSRLRLAGVLVRVGDPEEGAAVGRTALREATNLQSQRVTTELERLWRSSTERSGPAVVELRDELDVALAERRAASWAQRGS